MGTQVQPELIPGSDPNWKSAKDDALAVTPLSLMKIALDRGQVEQLQILQDMHFKQQDRDAEVEFNKAMNAAQSEIHKITPNAYNQQTKSKWATYDKLDADIRPIYIRHGFSLSFDSGECPKPEHVRAFCFVSHREGHTRKYQAPDMPLPIKGPQGKDVMTTTHGTAAAMSYSQRYLLKYIFNIAIGEDDTDGNAPTKKEMAGLDDWCSKIADAADYQEMREAYDRAFAIATEEKNQAAKDALIAARESWRKRRGMK